MPSPSHRQVTSAFYRYFWLLLLLVCSCFVDCVQHLRTPPHHLCLLPFNCISLCAVTFSIVSTSFHLHGKASVMRTDLYVYGKWNMILNRSRDGKKFNKSTRVQWMRTMTDISLGTRMFRMRFTFNTFSIHISGFFSPWYFNDGKICRRVKNYLMSESVANVVYAASAYYVWHVMILYTGRKNPAPIKCATHRRHRGPTRCYHCSIRMQKQMSAVDFVPFGFQHL